MGKNPSSGEEKMLKKRYIGIETLDYGDNNQKRNSKTGSKKAN
jgi:hypothetical protein